MGNFNIFSFIHVECLLFLGRAVLLTQDKTSMFKSLGQVAKFWKLQKSFSCNIGGLTALIFMFSRTAASP
jgi:hypothetical protein